MNRRITMDYYQILGISFSDNTTTIKKHYYKLAKQYHPDKFSGDTHKCEEFKQLSEAYSTLSNPKKRYIYDIQRIATIFDINLNMNLDEDDRELLYTYYQTICESVEFRLFYNLFQSFPNKQRFWTHVKRLFKGTKNHSVTLHPKSIDCRNLTEDFTIHLYRNLRDVYENIAKEIIIITKRDIYRIFVTHSDYEIHLSNDIYSLTIAIETKHTPHIIINGHDIHLTINRDLYHYFFESTVTTTFLNHIFEYDSRDLTHKQLTYAGLRNPINNQRGNLIIHNEIIYHMDMNIAQHHRTLLKTILSQ